MSGAKVVPLTVRGSSIDGWWNIVRAEHDRREWTEPTRYGFAWCMSERLEPRTCVEGSAAEIVSVARGILAGTGDSFKRCAAEPVDCDGVKGWRIYSPRNTHEGRALVVTAECAEALAREILARLAPDVNADSSAAGDP